MWPSIICFRKPLAGLACVALLCLSPAAGRGQVFKTQQQALRDAFPEGSEVSRHVLFLTEAQAKGIQKLAKSKLDSRIVTYYKATRGDSVMGFAFFATRVVRTKPATFMVLLAPDGRVERVEVLAFYEPTDYLPAANWFKLFLHKALGPNLWPGKAIHNVTGATLSTRAITRGVREILAIYQIAIAQEGSN